MGKLKQLILKTPEEFGVTKEGLVINPQTGKEVQGFNLDSAIARMINPKGTLHIQSPPGTKFFKKNVESHVAPRQLIDPTLIGRGKNSFKPSIWKK